MVMQTSLTPSSPRAAGATLRRTETPTTKTETAPTTPTAAPTTGAAPSPAADGFDTSSRPTIARAPSSSTGSSAPAGSPELAAEANGQRAAAHAAGLRGHRAGKVEVGDARSANRTGAKPSDEQTAFIGEMKAAGVDASHPPTSEQLKQYFGTFNNDKDRPKALEAYERYNDAYHTHIANAGGGDVEYSKETHYQLKGNKKLFKSFEEMEKASKGKGDYLEIPTADASSWGDVTTKRSKHEGKYVNDCEGFAFTAQDLLGAAGYKTEQVATSDPLGGNAHAMTVVKDPKNKLVGVTSNGDFFAGTNEKKTLDEAYVAAGAEGPAKAYYRGATQAEAQARMVSALEKW